MHMVADESDCTHNFFVFYNKESVSYDRERLVFYTPTTLDATLQTQGAPFQPKNVLFPIQGAQF